MMLTPKQREEIAKRIFWDDMEDDMDYIITETERKVLAEVMKLSGNFQNVCLFDYCEESADFKKGYDKAMNDLRKELK